MKHTVFVKVTESRQIPGNLREGPENFGKGDFPFADEAEIRLCQLHQLLGEEGKAGAADDDLRLRRKRAEHGNDGEERRYQ